MIVLASTKQTLSESQENYIKQIFLLTEDIGVQSAGTQSLADRLAVAPASVTVMAQRLRDLGLVQYFEYKGVSLTLLGRKVALEIIRHHRLLESFLCKALGYGWDEVHEEAEKLEHHISETLEARMAAWLGNPEVDPHGDPIPNADLIFMCDTPKDSLIGVREGFSGRIVRVATQDRDELNLLSQLHLTPGQHVQVIAVEPGGVRVGVSSPDSKTNRFLLPAALASKILVQDEE